jgi:hypothetical protein
MLKKTVLAIATVAMFGLSAVAVSSPAQAGFWYHGAWVDHESGWEHYKCHWEVRKMQVWHHNVSVWEKQRVRVCD